MVKIMIMNDFKRIFCVLVVKNSSKEFVLRHQLDILKLIFFISSIVLFFQQDWSLPAEAFQPRHELEFSNAPPVPPPHYSPANDSDGNSFQATSNNHKETISNGAAVNDLYINVKLPIIPQWDCSSLVTDILVAYAEVSQ